MGTPHIIRHHLEELNMDADKPTEEAKYGYVSLMTDEMNDDASQPLLACYCNCGCDCYVVK